MSAPDPHQIDDAIAGIIRRLRGLADQYRWLHPSAFRSPAGGIGGGTSHTVRDVSDTLVSSSHARHDVERAGKLILAAEQSLASAWSALMDCQAGIEDHQRLTVEAASERQLPRTITKDELKLAKEALGRRVARGERFGE